jgi:phosphopantetheinyl transferase (holo-ACP synthase)
LHSVALPQLQPIRTKKITMKNKYTCNTKLKGKLENGEYCVKYFALKNVCVKVSADRYKVQGCDFDTRNKFHDDEYSEYVHISRAEYTHIQKVKKLNLQVTMLHEMDPLFMAMQLGI